MRSRSLYTKILLAFNSICLILLLVIIIEEDYPHRILSKFSTKSVYNYMDNLQYKRMLDFYKVYSKPGNVVMLGDSLTAQIDWNELLNRTDIVNRGIGGDVTEGFLNRMEYVYKVRPKICFILGGGNDILNNIPEDTTIRNISIVIQGLKEHKILLVLESVLYSASDFRDSENYNRKVENLNKKLYDLAIVHSIEWLDLNRVLSKNGTLRSENSFDGIHLTKEGYFIWKQEVERILKKNNM